MSSSSDLGTLEKSVLALSAKQICDFFSKNTSATQEECNQLAQQILSQPVYPTPVQGVTSYTITAANDAGDSVVQFRNGDNALDIALFACIERVYSPFMPNHQYYGTLGALHVYKIANVGGKSVYFALKELQSNQCELLQRTVGDLARSVDTLMSRKPRS